MRLAVILIFTAGLGFGGWRIADAVAEPSASDLRALYEAHDWFRLREAIAEKDVPALYRGAVAAAFNRTDQAETALQPLINGTSAANEANDADDWLSYMFVRAGQYQRAAALMDEGTPLLALLRTLSNQTVSRFAPSSVACRLFQQRLFIPLTIQGAPAEFFVDSDANFSFLSESEARSLGLTVRDSSLKVHGAGGIATGFRTAVAEELTVGNVKLQDVAFMVMPDSEAIFSHLSTNQRGAIGLPVLLAFKTLHLGKGILDIGTPSVNLDRVEQNLCFDGLDPVTRVSFEQQRLPVILDTGAAETEIWPPFARQFSNLIASSGKPGTAVQTGFGGALRIPETRLHELVVGWGGGEVRLERVRVLLGQTTPNSQRYYGRLGLDALLSRDLRIDFQALKLTLQ